MVVFFFQAEDGIRDLTVTGVQTCALPICVNNPALIEQAAARYGAQCIVAAIDAKAISPGRWEVYTHGGRIATGRDAVLWAREAVRLGAGEILLTSMDRDGARSGFDLGLTRAVADAV